MALQQFQAEVWRIRSLTPEVREIQFQLREPPEIVFKPGQFVSFQLLSGETGRVVTRPYSIASAPFERQQITVVLNYVPGGPGSSYLFSLKEGDRVQFRGPAGSFYLRDDPTRDLLFVATGTGIAPIRSMLLDLTARHDPRSARLYWGLRGEQDLYYQDELDRLSTEHANVQVIVTLSRPARSWAGRTGRVTRLVDEEIRSVDTLAVYLCGNSAMITEVTAILSSKGLCPIYREKYYDDSRDEAED